MDKGSAAPFQYIIIFGSTPFEIDPHCATMIAHAENDNTISIKECYDLARHAKTKSWDDNGKEGSVIVKEVYFSSGGHNLLKNSETEPVVFDVIIIHFFQYLGRPCSTSSTVGVGGFPPPIDMAWPSCKKSVGESESVEKKAIL